MSEQRPEKTGRRSGGVLMILAVLLLLAAAGGVGWLHLTGRLEQLLADSPSIAVELPATVAESTVAESAAPEPTPEAEPAPLDEAEIAPAPAETPAEVEHAVPGHAAPVPADSTAPSTAPSGQSGEVPPPEAAPKTAAPEPASPETAADQPADAPPPAPDTQEAAPEEPAADLAAPPEAPVAEVPAAEAPAGEASVAEAPVAEAPVAETPAADEPPPPAPPAPEPAPDSPAEATPAPDVAAEAGHGTAEEPAADADGEAAPAEGQTPAENPQVAAATVPPGTVPAWQRLAQPFPEDETRPRIAVVVAGLGLSEAATTAAIQQLPAEITLSFSPYSNRIEEWVAAARAAGHEVLIDLPMEPTSFPRDDPGPQALLTSLSAGANAERLAWVLNRVEGYGGVATFMGSRFTTSVEHLQPVIDELKRRGLLILDSRDASDSLTAKLAHESGLAYVINDRFLDNEASRVAIDGRLQQIERIARTRGVAVAMGYAYPVTIERLTAWSRGLAGKGLTLAPISAVAGRQEVR